MKKTNYIKAYCILQSPITDSNLPNYVVVGVIPLQFFNLKNDTHISEYTHSPINSFLKKWKVEFDLSYSWFEED